MKKLSKSDQPMTTNFTCPECKQPVVLVNKIYRCTNCKWEMKQS